MSDGRTVKLSSGATRKSRDGASSANHQSIFIHPRVTMPDNVQEMIVEDMLEYTKQHDDVCLEVERGSVFQWLTYTDGEWVKAQYDSSGDPKQESVSEDVAKTILSTNRFMPIPVSKANGDPGKPSIWDAIS